LEKEFPVVRLQKIFRLKGMFVVMAIGFIVMLVVAGNALMHHKNPQFLGNFAFGMTTGTIVCVYALAVASNATAKRSDLQITRKDLNLLYKCLLVFAVPFTFFTWDGFRVIAPFVLFAVLVVPRIEGDFKRNIAR
jgi:hypothetical protein